MVRPTRNVATAAVRVVLPATPEAAGADQVPVVKVVKVVAWSGHDEKVARVVAEEEVVAAAVSTSCNLTPTAMAKSVRMRYPSACRVSSTASMATAMASLTIRKSARCVAEPKEAAAAVDLAGAAEVDLAAHLGISKPLACRD